MHAEHVSSEIGSNGWLFYSAEPGPCMQCRDLSVLHENTCKSWSVNQHRNSSSSFLPTAAVLNWARKRCDDICTLTTCQHAWIATKLNA